MQKVPFCAKCPWQLFESSYEILKVLTSENLFLLEQIFVIKLSILGINFQTFIYGCQNLWEVSYDELQEFFTRPLHHDTYDNNRRM